MNKNRHGFTLVELLVTIVVLGIVTGISIPLIRNIRNGNEDKQYITYMSSLKYSAKLYVDSYTEDLFGHEDSGCAIIQYTDLEDKNLVNDISLSDVSCATEDTYIRVVKLGEKYGYSVSLGCGNKNSEGKVESITIKYPEEVISKDSCGIDAKTIMDFQTTPEKSDAVKYKRRNVTLTISSATGVHTGAEIQYGFSKDKGTTVEGGWTSLPISITGEKKQKERIEAGETISIDSDKLTTPAGLTGDYYLVLRIDKLQDVLGRAWTTDKDQSKYIYKGPFRVDNTPPTISDIKVDSTTTDYHNLSTKVTVTGSDNYSSGNNLKMCISESSNDCDASKYKKYTSSSQDITVSGNYDGKTRTIYVHLKDAAGNHSSQSVTYTVASKITYDGNGNTGGSTAVTYCDNNVDCTLRSNGFTKTGYDFDGWYTAKTGGTKYGATTKLTGNITVYAHWNASNYTITYNLDGGSVSGNPTSYTITSNDITLKNPTKIGYTFEGWTGSNGNTKQKSVKISKGSTGNKSYTANWSMNKPATPVISNPKENKWTNANIDNINIFTTSPSGIVGKWYYRYGNSGSYTVWNDQDGKTSFSYTESAEQNRTIYVIVCNKEASSATDSSNCSDAAASVIKIDKTPPVIMFSNFVSDNYPNTRYISHSCTETVCAVYYSTATWLSYNFTVSCVDSGSGCPSDIDTIFQTSSGFGECGSYTTSTWVKDSTCSYESGKIETWTKEYHKTIDNAGNPSLVYRVDTYITWR